MEILAQGLVTDDKCTYDKCRQVTAWIIQPDTGSVSLTADMQAIAHSQGSLPLAKNANRYR